MKFLLDQGLPRSTAALMRGRGRDALHVAEVGLSTATDLAILNRARSEDRAIITLDADFHALLMVNRASSPSVIRLRLEGLKADEVADLVDTVLAATAAELGTGALVTVTPHAIRVHRLR